MAASGSNAQILPAVVGNGDIYSLFDLCNSDFMMSASDKDFELTHEQLLKCVKIILYKQNL